MRVVSVFAGIGGFDLAFKKAGHEISLLCENDPAAQSVLRKRFPGTRIHGDILTLKNFPRGTDVLTGGFPCQNLSMVGDKAGLAGSDSGLIKRLLHMIQERPVPWVVLENVPFMLHLANGRALRFILRELESAGYSWAYRTVDALAFGLPQRRRRVLIVASRIGRPEDVLFADEGKDFPPEPLTLDLPIGFYWTEGRSGSGLTLDAIPPLKCGSSIGIPSPPAVLMPDGAVVRPPISELERLQGFRAGWTKPAEAVDPRARWRLVGNALPVPMGQWIAAKLDRPGSYDQRRALRLYKSEKLPPAAFGQKGRHFVADVGLKPTRRKRPSLSEFMRAPWDNLSARAIRGFISRAREGNLRFPPEFLDRIEAAGDEAEAQQKRGDV